ncbi:META domain-containing protein [Colwelliaceae bacterium BS250]
MLLPQKLKNAQLKFILPVVVMSSMLLSACQNSMISDESTEQLTLVGQPWQLITLSGKPAILGESQRPLKIEFLTENNVFRGFAGCNNYSGGFTYTDNSIEFGPAMATRKFCADFSEQENKYLMAISNAKYFQIKNQKLTLTDKTDQVIAVYEPLKGLEYSQ